MPSAQYVLREQLICPSNPSALYLPLHSAVFLPLARVLTLTCFFFCFTLSGYLRPNVVLNLNLGVLAETLNLAQR